MEMQREMRRGKRRGMRMHKEIGVGMAMGAAEDGDADGDGTDRGSTGLPWVRPLRLLCSLESWGVADCNPKSGIGCNRNHGPPSL